MRPGSCSVGKRVAVWMLLFLNEFLRFMSRTNMDSVNPWFGTWREEERDNSFLASSSRPAYSPCISVRDEGNMRKYDTDVCS